MDNTGGFMAAWLLGLGLVVWNQSHTTHKPPAPGALAGVTGLFAALALLAEISPRARPVITLAAWGLDLAGVLNLWPEQISGKTSSAGLGADVSTALKAQSAQGGQQS